MTAELPPFDPSGFEARKNMIAIARAFTETLEGGDKFFDDAGDLLDFTKAGPEKYVLEGSWMIMRMAQKLAEATGSTAIEILQEEARIAAQAEVDHAKIYRALGQLPDEGDPAG